jgi:hypothetical protein
MEKGPPGDSQVLQSAGGLAVHSGWQGGAVGCRALGGCQDSSPLICHTLQVHLKVSVPKGVQFVGHPSQRHLTKKLCVPRGETDPTWLVLSLGDLGLANITGEGACLQVSRGLWDRGDSPQGGVQALWWTRASPWRSIQSTRVSTQRRAHACAHTPRRMVGDLLSVKSLSQSPRLR